MNETTAMTTTPSSTALALLPRSFEEAERIADKLAKSSLVPKHFAGKPQDVFWAVAYGADLGLSPTAALQAIYVVHGRPGLYADAMVALVLSAVGQRGQRLCEYFRCIESSSSAATFETRRQGDAEPVRKRVTMEMAREAGWTSNAKYKSEPARMLEARAKSWLARLVYPDVLAGVHAVEELETIDMVETSAGFYSAPPPPPAAPANDSTAVVDAEVVEPAANSPEDAGYMRGGEVEDELEAEVAALRAAIEAHDFSDNMELPAEITERLVKLPRDSAERRELRELYANRMEAARAKAAAQ